MRGFEKKDENTFRFHERQQKLFHDYSQEDSQKQLKITVRCYEKQKTFTKGAASMQSL
jgi:hypothetical protein